MIFEAEFAPGLLDIVTQEIRDCIGTQNRILQSHRDDSLQFTFDGDLDELRQLKTVISVYVVVQYDIPRPKALLGHEHYTRLLDVIRDVCDLNDYQSFYVSAAGSQSSVMMRIKSELATSLGLTLADDEGDLLLRIRRTPKSRGGWDVLVRITPRPLATREWRVCNYQGALNASIAHAMIYLSHPTPSDHFLNIACGSGTIMIERQHYGEGSIIIGCDISIDTLACATENITEAKAQSVKLVHTDAIQLPFASQSVNKLMADLPFGQLTGSHDVNEWLYPAILNEAGRVATQDARFVIITHEVTLMDQTIKQSNFWKHCEEPLKINQSGLHPRIYILERL